MKDPNLQRKGVLPLKTVLRLVVFTPKELSAASHPEVMKEVEGDLINMTSLKLQTFAKSGIRCVVCGCKGEFFAKEKYPDQPHYHLNLYAMKNGLEVLMTKDHVVPIAKGGRDRSNNFQTLCIECNRKKGDFTAQDVKKKKLK